VQGKGAVWMPLTDVFFCAAAAWYTAGLFIRLPPKNAAGNAAVVGLLCALPAALLPMAGLTGAWILAVFLLLALIVPAQKTAGWTDRALAFPLAIGCYAVLSFLCLSARTFFPAAGALGAVCALTAGFCAAGSAMRGLFPPENWGEFFSRTSQEQFPVRRWLIWLALWLMAGLELMLTLTAGRPESALRAAVLGAASLFLYWGTVYAVCLMTAYRRERLTALIDQDYRSEMQTFMSVIRSQRHDYNFHVQALSGLVSTGDLDVCRKYLDNLVRDSAAMNILLPVKDPAIAALIHSFRVMGQENGIELHLDIQNDLSCVVTSVYETNKIIGNLLQNAIDEVRGHTDKSFGIHLYILKRGENCIIRVTNKIVSDANARTYLEDVYKPGLSTKTGHEGIGLSSVRQLLGRYRGVVYSRLEDDTIHFIAKIPLRMEGAAP
jgi:signal transduction histidine kinase